jgi:lipoprotein-releasing system permease protein
MLRGVVPAEETKVSVLGEKMVQGKLTDLAPGSFNIVLGVNWRCGWAWVSATT